MTSGEDEIRFSEPYEWVPDGEFDAECIDYSRPMPFRGTRKVYLTFKLLNEPYAGTKIFMALNVGWGNISPGCKYFKCWTAANDNRLPSKSAIMSPRIFKNKTFKVTTRTVIPKRGTKEMPFDFHYSVVDSLNLPDT